MESYLPNDVPSIQKQYILAYLELSIMSNTLWLEQDLISRLFIVTKHLLTQCEIG